MKITDYPKVLGKPGGGVNTPPKLILLIDIFSLWFLAEYVIGE